MRSDRRDVVATLLNSKVNVNVPDRQGRTPLRWAVEFHRQPMAEVLLEKGADANAKDASGITPLQWAARNGRTDFAKLLLNKGATLDIFIAAALGDAGSVEKFLNENPVLAKSTDKDGATPLPWAVETDQPDTMKLLLAAGADVNARNHEQKTPLLWAQEADQVDAMKLLLANKADVNAVDKEGFTALHRAVMQAHRDAVQLLLASGAGVNAKDAQQKTPLHWAAQSGLKEITQLVLANHAEVNATDTQGLTPLQVAVHFEREEVAELLANKGATVDIFSAAALGNVDRVTKLLKTNPKLATERDRDGSTALHWAAREGRKAVAEVLLAKGADVNVKGESSLTPVQLAAAEGHEDLVELLRRHTGRR